MRGMFVSAYACCKYIYMHQRVSLSCLTNLSYQASHRALGVHGGSVWQVTVGMLVHSSSRSAKLACYTWWHCLGSIPYLACARVQLAFLHRDAEVLSLFAAIISKLREAMGKEVPRIFEAVFECTLQMITKNFEARLLVSNDVRAVSESCLERPIVILLPVLGAVRFLSAAAGTLHVLNAWQVICTHDDSPPSPSFVGSLRLF